MMSQACISLWNNVATSLQKQCSYVATEAIIYARQILCDLNWLLIGLGTQLLQLNVHLSLQNVFILGRL